MTAFLEALKHWLWRAWQWVRSTPGLPAFAAVAGCAWILLKLTAGYHDEFEKWEAAWEAELKPVWLGWYETLYPYMGLATLVAFVVWLLHAVQSSLDTRRMVWPTAALGGYVLLWIMVRELRDQWWISKFGMMGEPDAWVYLILKWVMLSVLLLSPAAMVAWHSRQPMLQKYTLRAFSQPLLFCYAAFCTLWILIDFMDKVGEFQQADTPKTVILKLYLDLLPAIYVMVTPAAVLLACLYSLTKLSRANELVSMLMSGMSLIQILKPILVVVAWLSLMGMAMNYHWAPRADGQRDAVLRDLAMKGKGSSAASAAALMYRNEDERRTWYIGTVPFDLLKNKMKRVLVYQMDGKDRIKTVWRAESIKWWANRDGDSSKTGMWSFYDGTERSYKDQVMSEERFFDSSVDGIRRVDIHDWKETPWSIIGGSLVPDNLGVVDLVCYEKANRDLPSVKLAPFSTHFHHRFAYPWQAFVVVLLAAPLGVAFSRRGALGGIAAAVIIFFGLMFVNEFFINLGKGKHLAPWLAAWMPNFLFGGAGYLLLLRRAQNKDLPSLSPAKWLKDFRAWVASNPLSQPKKASA
jgi:LPS export ABC transporter permease LptG